MTTAILDASAIIASLVREHPEHREARALMAFVATGLTDVAVVCSVPTMVVARLVRCGADPAWAADRGRDLIGMFPLLDITDEDATQALAGGDAMPRPSLTAAAMRRHGARRIVADAGRLAVLAEAGIGEVVSIADADARAELLMPETA